ncbi:energy transducer TonB [Mucilaginibacter mali]|uniref:Energy transducer TonB n=1 Tax=Mucilaginibacter mali TaxID=2740462 RepID=A0A7D4TXP0_9SPHI|nr:energy transducer TonB [Mucilaginibacter mali]QKJ30537.1 energy transducer TonB [Mucilaginibacter mali]
MNWIYYLLEANLYLAAFYLVYYFVLRRETYYQLNRAYLLAACIIAFIIPLMQVGSLRTYTPQPQPTVSPAISVIDPAIIQHDQAIATVNTTYVWTTADYYLLAYMLVAVIMLLVFGIKLFKLIQLSRKTRQAGNGFYMVEIADDNNAFSFFKYLFIDPKLAGSTAIVQHELVHIRQRHSLDIVFLELFKIVNWFNPVAYLLQNSIKELHEFIADQETARQQDDVNGYTDFLINNAYGFIPRTLTHNFFNKNLLKTRIIMLHQKRSGGLARLKLLLILPLCAGLLCASTLAFSKTYGYVDLLPHKATADSGKVPPPPPPPAAPHDVKYTGMQTPPPPPPPMVLNKNYIELGIYMQNHLKYPKVAADSHTAGTVIINFRLDEKHMITDLKVEKSIGNGLDEEAIRLMHDFKKPVNDKPGYHTIGLDFRLKDQRFKETVSPEAKNKPGYVGELSLPGSLRFPPPVIKADGVSSTSPKPKVDRVRFPPPVVVADTNIKNPPKPKVDRVRFPPPVVRADVNTKTSPKHKVDQVRFPPPVIRPDGKVPPPPPKPKVDRVRFPDTTGAADFSEFYSQMARTVRYSSEAREKGLQGRVIAVFNIDSDRRIRNIKIMRGLNDAQNEELVNRIFDGIVPASAKTGVNYIMTFNFNLVDDAGNNVKMSPNFKGKNYIKDYKPNNFPYTSLHEVVLVSRVK